MSESTHKAPGGFEGRLRALLRGGRDPQVGYATCGAAGSDLEIATTIATAASCGLTAPTPLLCLDQAHAPPASLVFPEIRQGPHAKLRKPAAAAGGARCRRIGCARAGGSMAPRWRKSRGVGIHAVAERTFVQGFNYQPGTAGVLHESLLALAGKGAGLGDIQ